MPTKSKQAIIETEVDIKRGIKALKQHCPIMRRAYALAGQPPLRRTTAGFEGLARIVVGQQVSIASANAIWGRLSACVCPFDPVRFAALPDDALRAAGLSMGKMRTLHGLVTAINSGALDFAALQELPDDDVRDRLVSLKGIGPWSADVYLLFCLGRADAFAAGDLALQVAAARLIGDSDRVSAAQLLLLAENWRPWRGVAARMLWTYYGASGSGSSRISGSSGVPV